MSSLLYIIWNADPQAFTIPIIDWPVRWYGILFVAGLVLSQYIMFYIFEKDGKTKKNVEDLTIYVVIGTVVGARLGHVLFYDLPYYIQNPGEVLMIWHGGLASHGGAVGILLAIYLYCRKFKFNYLWVLDRLVIVVCLTGAFIRTGNFMNSEIVGTVSHLPWAVQFVNAYPPSLAMDPRHPAQLYEAFYCLILMAVLFYIWKTKRRQMANGFIFGIFLIVLWTLRFIDEFFKVDQESFEAALPINMGQILSIPFVIIGIIILIQAINRQKRTQST